MFTWFVVGALVFFAVLYWVFFIRPAREQAKVRTLLRNSQMQRRYAAHTQSVAVEQETHLTGRAYGALLRMAHGDRQKVELWIVELQRQMPGVTRVHAIEILAERSLAPQAVPA